MSYYELILSFRIALMVLMVLTSLFLIFAILRQPGNSQGSSAITGVATTDTFYGKNKSKRFENQLKKWTIICGIFLAVCSILFFVLGLL